MKRLNRLRDEFMLDIQFVVLSSEIHNNVFYWSRNYILDWCCSSVLGHLKLSENYCFFDPEGYQLVDKFLVRTKQYLKGNEIRPVAFFLRK